MSIITVKIIYKTLESGSTPKSCGGAYLCGVKKCEK